MTPRPEMPLSAGVNQAGADRMTSSPIPPLAGAPVLAHIDGGARGNPGDAGYGAYVATPAGDPIAEVWGFLGTRTNNYAEYVALLAALTYAIRAGAGNCRVRSDSELLVRQIQGIYKVRHPALQILHRRARTLIGKVPSFGIEHVRREQNREADRLANRAMDDRAGSGHFDLAELLGEGR